MLNILITVFKNKWFIFGIILLIVVGYYQIKVWNLQSINKDLTVNVEQLKTENMSLTQQRDNFKNVLTNISSEIDKKDILISALKEKSTKDTSIYKKQYDVLLKKYNALLQNKINTQPKTELNSKEVIDDDTSKIFIDSINNIFN